MIFKENILVDIFARELDFQMMRSMKLAQLQIHQISFR